MTSPLRRKRPTTVRGRNLQGRTLASLLLLVCWLASVAPAQQPAPFPTPADVKIIEGLPTGTPRWLDPHLVRVQARVGAAPTTGRDEPQTAYLIPFGLPGTERLFRIEGEDALFQRMSQEARERKPEELVFPEEPVLSKEQYYGREWPRTKMVVEPHYVCHGRLLFETPNSERYGWELGVFQPLISTGAFYKDVVLLPFHYFTHPCRCYDCSAGKCLPGDPVPLLLYPPELTLTGALGEAAVIGTLFAIFP